MITNSEITAYMQLNKKSKTGLLDIKEQVEFLRLKELYVNSLATNPKTSVNDADLKRISELSAKYKTSGLTEEEDIEYVTLRLAYVLGSKKNVSAQMNNIDVIDKSGNVENLGEKYGSKS